MRRLLYVPVIHQEADLGSLGPALDRASAALYGEARWAQHKDTVDRFWQAIEEALRPLEGASLKIYQDGLVAEGEMGQKIVAEAARRGSRNHQIVLDLLRRGAELRLTEDVALLLEERQRLLDLAQPPSTPTGPPPPPPLTEERDRFVARRINDTLREGETGILFMGAYHDIPAHLAQDIVIKALKGQDKVRAYFQELLAEGNEVRLGLLAGYLAAPVSL